MGVLTGITGLSSSILLAQAAFQRNAFQI